MKYAIVTIFIFMVFLISCTKEKKEGDCRLTSYTRYSYGGHSTTFIGYNNEGKISSLRHSPVPGSGFNSQVNYYPSGDSIVTENFDSRTVYYLNASDLADSSQTSYLDPNPNGLSLRYAYSYDPEGFLISQRMIFTQVYNGNLINDTSFTTYTITNGNVSSMVQNGLEVRYTYSDKTAQNNRLLPPFLPRDQEYPFLGKTSRNLLDKVETSTGQILYSYEYQIHGNGNVTRILQKPSAVNDSPSYTEFTYECNN